MFTGKGSKGARCDRSSVCYRSMALSGWEICAPMKSAEGEGRQGRKEMGLGGVCEWMGVCE